MQTTEQAAITAKRIAAATLLARNGFEIVETAEGHKEPLSNAWQTLGMVNPDDITTMLSRPARQYGVFPPAGSRVAIIDFDKQGIYEAMRHLLPDTLTIRTSEKESGWRGVHAYIRLPDGVDEADVPRSFEGGEVRIAGSGQTVGPWGRHPSGTLYEPEGTTRVIATASVELIEALQASKARRSSKQNKARTADDDGWVVTEPGRHEFLASRGRYLRGVGLTGTRLSEELHRLNTERCQPPKSDEEVDALVKWIEANITDDPPKDDGARLVRSAEKQASNSGQGAATATATASGPHDAAFPRTDAGNSEYFASLYGDIVRYDWRRERWLLWDGTRWKPDSDGAVVRLAVAAMRRRQADALAITDHDEKLREVRWAIGSESKSRLSSMLTLAQSHSTITDAGEQWDADPWVLGVPNGVVDLRTGKLREARQTDRITKQAGVAFDPLAKAPTWESFKTDIANGDDSLIDFIDTALGYSLTGDTREQCFFLLHGSGGNGKSTLLDVIREVFGEYAITSPFSTFTASRYGDGGPSNDLARLDGARFVTAIEPNEGATFHEGRVKELTGGDEVTARYLHKEFFSFKPQMKLWLATNHKPGVRDLSRGFWRRVRLLPFERDFESEGKVNKSLPETLRAESAGILAAVVRACVRWQVNGLVSPPVVLQAVADYKEEANPISDWITDRINGIAGSWTSLTDLHTDYKTWMADHWRAREALGRNTFSKAMEARFKAHKRNTGQGFDGVELAPLPHIQTVAERERSRQNAANGDVPTLAERFR